MVVLVGEQEGFVEVDIRNKNLVRGETERPNWLLFKVETNGKGYRRYSTCAVRELRVIDKIEN
jgi:hypothetical protein